MNLCRLTSPLLGGLKGSPWMQRLLCTVAEYVPSVRRQCDPVRPRSFWQRVAHQQRRVLAAQSARYQARLATLIEEQSKAMGKLTETYENREAALRRRLAPILDRAAGIRWERDNDHGGYVVSIGIDTRLPTECCTTHEEWAFVCEELSAGVEDHLLTREFVRSATDHRRRYPPPYAPLTRPPSEGEAT